MKPLTRKGCPQIHGPSWGCFCLSPGRAVELVGRRIRVVTVEAFALDANAARSKTAVSRLCSCPNWIVPLTVLSFSFAFDLAAALKSQRSERSSGAES